MLKYAGLRMSDLSKYVRVLALKSIIIYFLDVDRIKIILKTKLGLDRIRIANIFYIFCRCNVKDVKSMKDIRVTYKDSFLFAMFNSF